MKKFFNLFRKNKRESVTDIIAKYGNTPRVSTIRGRRFLTVWNIRDIDNGYKVVADGYTTRDGAIKHAESLNIHWIISCYEIEII